MLFLLTYATGALRKEIINLRSAEADLDAGVLALGIGEKNNGMRRIRYPPFSSLSSRKGVGPSSE